MCVIEEIKETRKNLNLTQEEFANKIGISRNSYIWYENKKRPIPDDIVIAIANHFDKPKILAEHLYEKGTEFFNTPILNNVDTYPSVVIDALIEESKEALNALEDIKRLIRNKIELTEQDIKVLLELEEQVGDLYTALKMHFITMQERYNVKIKDIEKRCNNKLKSKGYITRKQVLAFNF
jgi:transcriptional regulator with XRE-family HTH domain